jgi:ABC-type dipeptide/oligopeptide/nickel transport system permease component
MSLAAFIARRFLLTIPLVLLVMLGTFALLRGWGGNPFRPPEGYVVAPVPLQNQLRDFYHLDDPWFVEFAVYVKNVFTFHFGPSMVFRSLDVTEVIRHSFSVTLLLAGLAAAWAAVLGIPLGVLAAVRSNTVADFITTSMASVFLVVPVFFLAFIASKYLVSEWHAFPIGWDQWRARILPSLVLSLAPLGYIARLIRAAVVETLQEDYVTAARARGLRRRRIIWVHVLRNSLAPFVSGAVPVLALLLTGTLFVERFFAIPGVGSFYFQAVETADYPLIMGLTVSTAVVILTANLVADILLVLADPRVREAQR